MAVCLIWHGADGVLTCADCVGCDYTVNLMGSVDAARATIAQQKAIAQARAAQSSGMDTTTDSDDDTDPSVRSHLVTRANDVSQE